MAEQIHYRSVNQLAEYVRTGQLSPVAVVETCLARIDSLNKRLNAFALVLADLAREQAAEAEREIRDGRWRGPLHGIPVGIKDFYDTAGIRTTAAFERFKNRVPARDAVSVVKLKAAGAIVIGKMNMDTLGMATTGRISMFGPVRNPWNEQYISGGSSSGSAAAVAAGMCYATLDTDAIGSCRLPAACCGVIGFKGSYGLISLEGVLEGEQADETISWYAHAGLTTRSVEDTVLLLNALADAESGSAASPLRIGIADNFKADAQITRIFGDAIHTIESLDHSVIPASAPFDIPRFGDLHSIERDRKTIGRRAFAAVDVLILPTLATPVLRAEDAGTEAQALSPAHTVFANYFGLPAITVPCGFDANGLPVGLQIVGKPGDDTAVLRLAHQFLEAAGTGKQHPIA